MQYLTFLLMLSMRIMLMLTLPGLFVPTVSASVRISGLDGKTESNTRLMLGLAEENCDAPDWKIRTLYAKADHEVDQALRALGYYHAAVKKSLVFEKDCWTADLAITLGPQVFVDEVSITINGSAENLPEFQKLRGKLLKTAGSPLDHSQYEKMKTRIEALAMESGYLHGSFTEKKLLIDKQSNKAQIKLVFDSGNRKVFDQIVVKQDALNPTFVDKYVSINSGDFYSGSQLAKTHSNLLKSGYFSAVDIVPDTLSVDDGVPITIKLQAKKRHHYGFGVGFDTDIGPLLSGAYTNRRLNEQGHFLNSELNLSPVLSTADANYNIPLADPINDAFSLGGGFKRENTETFETVSSILSARLKHTLANNWKQTLSTDLNYEDFTIGPTRTKTLLLVPAGNWLKSVSNNPLRPSKGYRANIAVSGSYENPLSDVSFLQTDLSLVLMQPFFWNSKFVMRTEIAATVVDQFDKLPPSYRFYAGGINSVRGYGYKELGPKDHLGNVVGGKFLSVVSLEYEKTVFEDWGVAAFVDSGNAFNPDSIRFKTGAGLGVRWYSPLGPVRVDFALPLDDADSSFQIHFAAGARI
ncbi:MAG: outer membrane protein assembly factor [Proteobacteria bacterium ST_bin11]|nr:MAG: outer membrane protein assembly factor [Proteobacteria bacterium ST_bin11]